MMIDKHPEPPPDSPYFEDDEHDGWQFVIWERPRAIQTIARANKHDRGIIGARAVYEWMCIANTTIIQNAGGIGDRYKLALDNADAWEEWMEQ
jgi:hypothetical protein